ncbi:hypothetical protein GPL17_33190 [Bradyrhizobium yuanmingense]|uniref:hypothetical protein n=1 Tax=Bradyrhizobium yuanmingense TaxID=108015 RepID=UPI0012FCBAF7|nr:hypothetical protein [Bradyrhizobium yuanmingense]MVT55289.1 hypothetical protein [Bradyrhizobium yuanmingense]
MTRKPAGRKRAVKARRPVAKAKAAPATTRRKTAKANHAAKKKNSATTFAGAAVGFAKDIRPMYTDTDIAHMRFFCDLSKRDDNQQHAQEILRRLKGEGGRIMPPPPARPWTKQQVALYQSWIDGGFQP